MPDFHLAATINQVGPHEFFVTVSAMAASGANEGTILRTDIATSRLQAEELSADVLLQVAKLVRERGDRVVDVGA